METHEVLGDLNVNGPLIESEKRGQFAHAVRTVVEGEDGVVVFCQ